MAEDVGKKIVEALRKQADVEIQHVVENPVVEEEIEFVDNVEEEEVPAIESETPAYQQAPTYDNDNIASAMHEQPAYKQSMIYNANAPFNSQNLSTELDGIDIPTNVAVLKQLIGQLPAGVTKQTGAQIIKQTMEALGIPMKGVLQEAQQVQEILTNSSRECQASIMEYKRQIGVLEQQSQKFQKQYAALNDIISLFIQTSNY